MAAVGFQVVLLVAGSAAAMAASHFELHRYSLDDPERVIDWPPQQGVATTPTDESGEWSSAPPLSLDAKMTMHKSVHGNYYTISVDVGTPAKTVNLQVDTSSPTSWIDYSKVPALLNSTTAKNTGIEVGYSSSKGQADGIDFKDKFCLAGASQPLCVASQSYVFSDQVIGFPTKKTFDGMLGLGVPSGFDQIAGVRTVGRSFLESANASTANLAFGLSLADANSFVTFGAAKDVMAEAPAGSGSPVTLPLTTFGEDDAMFWNMKMSMSIGGSAALAVKDVDVKLDSGSSIISAPKGADQYLQSVIQILMESPNNEAVGQMVTMLQREVNTYQQMFSALVEELSRKHCTTDRQDDVLCFCNVTLTPLHFVLNGEGGASTKITVTSKDLLTPIAKTKAGDAVCKVNIADGGEPFWTLGSVFLKKAYVVHDVAGKKATFFPTQAAAAALSAPTQPSATLGLSPMLLVGVLTGLVATAAATRSLRRRAAVQGRTPLLIG